MTDEITEKEKKTVEIKKHRPFWSIILAAAALLATLVLTIVFISGGSPAKRVEKKLALADRYMTELKYEEAIALYNEVLKIEPKSLEAYEGLIKAYSQSGREEDAQRILSALVDMYNGLSEEEKASEYGIRLKKIIDDLTGQRTANGQSATNGHGLCTKTTLYDIDGNVTANFTYEYDDNARLIKRTENLNDTDFPVSTVEFEYTDDGILKKATKRSATEASEVTTLELKSEGSSLSYYYKQTSNGPMPLTEGTVEYDAAGNGKGEIKTYDDSNQLYLTEQIDCDSTGRITKSLRTFGDGREEGAVEYIYDAGGTFKEIKYYYEDGFSSIEFSFAEDGGWTEYDKWNGDIREESVFYPNGNVQLVNHYSDGSVDYSTGYTYSDSWDTVVERSDYGGEGDYTETHLDTGSGLVSTESYMDGELIYNSEYEVGTDLFRPKFSFNVMERALFKAFWGYETVNPSECTNHVTCFDDYLPYIITNCGYFNIYKPVWNEYETDASGNVIKWHKYSLDRKYHIWAEYEYSE